MIPFEDSSSAEDRGTRFEPGLTPAGCGVPGIRSRKHTCRLPLSLASLWASPQSLAKDIPSLCDLSPAINFFYFACSRTGCGVVGHAMRD